MNKREKRTSQRGAPRPSYGNDLFALAIDAVEGNRSNENDDKEDEEDNANSMNNVFLCAATENAEKIPRPKQLGSLERVLANKNEKKKKKIKADEAKGETRTTKQPSKWWRSLDQEKCDPITLEPFCEQVYAPFELCGRKFVSSRRTMSEASLEECASTVGATRASTAGDVFSTTDDNDRNDNGEQKEQAIKHLFDPEALAEYVVNAKTFENPLTREPLESSDCQRLDEHLRKFSLKQFKVHKAFVNLQKEKKDLAENAERRTEEQRAMMQREREDLRRTLASSMFTTIRERRQHQHNDNNNNNNSRRNMTASTTSQQNDRPSSRNGFNSTSTSARNGLISNAIADREQHNLAAELQTSVEQQENAFRAFGAFAMVDDDIAMSRGQTLRAAQSSFSGWSNPSAIRGHNNNSRNLPLSSAENFPSLGSSSNMSSAQAGAPQRSNNNIGSGGWSEMAHRASSLSVNDTTATNVRRPRVVPPTTTTTTTTTNNRREENNNFNNRDSFQALLPNETVNADEQRRAQLANAFGISNPDSHVSAFAISGAKAAFKTEHLKAAKANPRLCAQIEQKFEDMFRDANNRRATFPPMTKFLRGVVHEYAELWGFTSQSYGNEPNRRVDVFRTIACKKPTINLREAILAHDEIKKQSEEKEQKAAANAHGGGGSSNNNIREPPEDAKEDDYFEGFTSYWSLGAYERLTAQFYEGATKSQFLQMLKPWRGQYAIEIADDDDDDAIYIAHFKNPASLKKASGIIGGGIKGQFKVKYAEQKSSSAVSSQQQQLQHPDLTLRSSEEEVTREQQRLHQSPPKIVELRKKKPST